MWFSPYRKRLLSSIAATMVNSVGFYLVLTYLPTYLTQYAGVNAGDAQLATDIALAYIFIVLAAGKVSDIIGRRRKCSVHLDLYPSERAWLRDSQHRFAADHHRCRADAVHHPFDQRLEHRLLSGRDVPRGVRYRRSWLSRHYHVLFVGTASMIAAALIDFTGNSMTPAYMMGICIIAGISWFTAHDYARHRAPRHQVVEAADATTVSVGQIASFYQTGLMAPMATSAKPFPIVLTGGYAKIAGLRRCSVTDAAFAEIK